MLTHMMHYPCIWEYDGVRLKKAKAPEKQEQGPLSLTNAMDTDEGQYMSRKIIDHTLELQETVSLPPGSPCATSTPPHYLSLGMPKFV